MDLFRKKEISAYNCHGMLAKLLSSWDLVFLGIGAIIGAGIFVLTGIVAATQTGPAIVISYVIAGFACAFAALAYAELAALIGGCGSAYGYAYAGFGELIAWIVGWDLILEYAIAVSAVSVGWSGYFNDLLKSLSLFLPAEIIQSPQTGGILNSLAMAIILALGFLLALGVKTSSRVNNTMVIIKLSVIALFIIIAATHVNPVNWSTFAPFGWQGVVEGASLIFFAYIGFDAVSTAAEEAKNPQRDLPRGIIGSLIICTVIYVVVAGLLTLMVNYSQLNVASPISHAMLITGHKIVAGLIGIGAIAGLSTVMLVWFYGLTRIFLAMARDGLLPNYFARIDHKTKAPIRIIFFCGLIMAILAGFVPMQELTALVNVGTLFAFITVCSGVIVLRYKKPELIRPFKTPMMPLIPVLGILSCFYLMINLPWESILRFIIWMSAGLLIYFIYSRHRSQLNKQQG